MILNVARPDHPSLHLSNVIMDVVIVVSIFLALFKITKSLLDVD